MPENPCDVTFDGIHADASAGTAQFTLGIGPQPSTGSLCLAGTGHTLSSGSLVFSDGINPAVTLPNLDVVEQREHSAEDGEYTEIQVRDRRWKWAKQSHVTGVWNRPEADGSTIPAALQKSARELVALCLDAMGETGYDVSALPNDFYPFVQWEFEPAARAANEVCAMCGCTLSLDGSDNVEVVKLGVGDDPPAADRESQDEAETSTEKADVYLVRGGRKAIQRTSTLETVGLDTDGTIQALADLSYYADALTKWGSMYAAALAHFQAWDNATDRAKYVAASQSVGRWFRVPADDRVYLPALATICETKTEGGQTTWKKPYVTSAALYLKGPDEVTRSASGELAVPWDLDAEAGVVKLQRDVAWADEYCTSFATLKLVWAYESIQSDGTLIDDDFYTYADGSGSAEHVEDASWMVLRGIIADGETDPVWQNQVELDAIAAKIVSYIKETDATRSSGDYLYGKVLDVRPDGKIRQVTWRVSAGGGAETRLVVNTDAPPVGRLRLQQAVDTLRRQAESASGRTVHIRTNLRGWTLPQFQGGRAGNTSAPPLPPGAFLGINSEIEDAPAECVVFCWKEGTTWDGAARSQIVAKPPQAGLTSLAITGGPIPANDGKGICYDSGHRIVKFYNRDDMTISVPGRLGCGKDSWYAQPEPLGPFLVEALISHPGAGPGRAFVKISPPGG